MFRPLKACTLNRCKPPGLTLCIMQCPLCRKIMLLGRCIQLHCQSPYHIQQCFESIHSKSEHSGNCYPLAAGQPDKYRYRLRLSKSCSFISKEATGCNLVAKSHCKVPRRRMCHGSYNPNCFAYMVVGRKHLTRSISSEFVVKSSGSDSKEMSTASGRSNYARLGG